VCVRMSVCGGACMLECECVRVGVRVHVRGACLSAGFVCLFMCGPVCRWRLFLLWVVFVACVASLGVDLLMCEVCLMVYGCVCVVCESMVCALLVVVVSRRSCRHVLL